jgi:predicted porin
MNKRLLAVAVAGAFAAPTAAFAQSSVTISGYIKGGFESFKLGNCAGAGRCSQTGVTDDSSQIQFNVTESLGGGLDAIAQMNMRFTNDAGTAITATGNTHVGLRSKSWGRIFVGRQDLHYFNRESDLTVRGPLRADSVALLAFVSPAGGGATQSIAGATRTPNVVHYTTPNWGGFTLIVAYSANAGAAAEADLGTTVRAGRAWNLNPNFAGSNWQIGYSYWTSKPDGGGATLATGDQRGDRLYGSYRWGGFKLGLAWDKSRIRAVGGGDIARRSAWSIPASYSWGPHSVHAHYTKAGNDKTTAADDAATMFAISYGYDLSKRTSAALTYARINNKAGAAYQLFTSTSLGIGRATIAGEDPRMWGVTLRHQF